MLKIFITGLQFVTLLSMGSEVTNSVRAGKEKKSYFKAQYAGNIGLISAGLGREIFNSKATADINLGYLPKHINGMRVFTISFKPSWNLPDFNIGEMNTGLYAGAALNYSIGRRVYGKIPDYYPRDYYWPNAFHFNPFAGIRVGSERSRFKLFAELGTVDYMIWFAWKNKSINIADIVNLAAGFMIDIPKNKR